MQHHHDPPPITYLATHFPAVSHTFIADEIDALERLGVRIETVSINEVRDVDRSADHGGRRRSTTYLKSTPKWRVAISVALVVIRHPSVLAIPLRSPAFGIRAAMWRYFHLAEAIVIFRLMRRTGSRHLHAHFGQAPATIAMYATEVAHRHRRGQGHTWSITIHGWHEFVGEREALLSEKLRRASFVVCVSDFTRSQLYRIAELGDWPKIHVVRCGVDLDRFALRSREPRNERRRIAIVARISPEKGHAILIDALAQLREQGVDLAVDAVGPDIDGYGDQLRDRAITAGVADLFTWHGSLASDRVAAILDVADVFCLPTFAEGLPVVIMEAMARGVPVVTTYISGIPELAINRETALVVPAARVDLLANALAEVVGDASLRQRLVTAAAAAVVERHDIVHNVKQLADLFGLSAEQRQ